MTKQPTEPFDPSVYLHSPDDLGRMHLEHAKFIKAHPGIKFGITAIDNYVIPMRPGDLTLIVGLSGHGKSSLLARLAKTTAQNIALQGAQNKECVIYCSWEQHAEELEAYFEADAEYTVSDYAWGRVTLDQVATKAMRRANFPLWMIGHSNKNVFKQTEPLRLPIVFQAIESMRQNYDATGDTPKPVLLCMDYAQLIPDENGHENRYQQVSAALRATKLLGLRVGCPIVIAAQCKQEVLNRDVPIPGMYDVYESSGGAHVPDKTFGIWRPWKTHRDQQSVTLAPGVEVPVTPETFILKMSKQRMEDGERTWVLSFNMAELKLAELEIHKEDLY